MAGSQQGSLEASRSTTFVGQILSSPGSMWAPSWPALNRSG